MPHPRRGSTVAVLVAALCLAPVVAAAQPGPGPKGAGNATDAPGCAYHKDGRGCPHCGHHGDEHGGCGGCAHEGGPRAGHGGPHGERGMHPEKLVRMAEKAGVKAATREKIADVAFEARKQAITLEAEVEKARLDLGRLMHEDETDDAKVLAQADAVNQAESALRRHRVQTMLSIRKLMTKAERAKLRKLMFEKHHGGRAGSPPGRGPGPKRQPASAH